jgi:hypothetical protein
MNKLEQQNTLQLNKPQFSRKILMKYVCPIAENNHLKPTSLRGMQTLTDNQEGHPT